MSDDPLEALDYYTLLQVSEQANSDDVRRAFHRFAAKYHPDRYLGAGAENAKVERAAEIYRRGAEAYKVLTDPARRKQYDAGLAQGQLRFDATVPMTSQRPLAAGTWPLQVRNPMARPFAIKAEQLYKAGDLVNARMNLRLALQKDAGNLQIQAALEDVEQRLSSK